MPPPRSWYTKENRPSVTICSLSLIIIGIVMIFAGGLVTYIYFTEITPPNYDAYYQRYVGSSFPRIVGILVLMAGLILFWGASIFLVYVNWSDNQNNNNNNNNNELDEPNNNEYYFTDNLMPEKSFQSRTVKITQPTVKHSSQQPVLERTTTATYAKENYIG